jgi:hypothetical protein
MHFILKSLIFFIVVIDESTSPDASSISAPTVNPTIPTPPLDAINKKLSRTGMHKLLEVRVKYILNTCLVIDPPNRLSNFNGKYSSKYFYLSFCIYLQHVLIIIQL